jgi:hypothetical protein
LRALLEPAHCHKGTCLGVLSRQQRSREGPNELLLTAAKRIQSQDEPSARWSTHQREIDPNVLNNVRYPTPCGSAEVRKVPTSCFRQATRASRHALAGIASGDVEIFTLERGSGGPAVHPFLPEHGRASIVTKAKAGAEGESYQGV